MTIDLTKTIAPKSDQLNADDFIGSGPMTIKITSVRLTGGDQPVTIGFENDGGKPWKPCKSMRRVLVQVWGADGAAYVGRELTLFCDPNVRFGNDKVGGIRISHMSGIDKQVALPITVSKGKRSPYVVDPLTERAAAPDAKLLALKQAAEQAANKGTSALKEWWSGLGGQNQHAVGGVAYLSSLKSVAELADADAEEITGGS